LFALKASNNPTLYTNRSYVSHYSEICILFCYPTNIALNQNVSKNRIIPQTFYSHEFPTLELFSIMIIAEVLLPNVTAWPFLYWYILYNCIATLNPFIKFPLLNATHIFILHLNLNSSLKIDSLLFELSKNLLEIQNEDTLHKFHCFKILVRRIYQTNISVIIVYSHLSRSIHGLPSLLL